MRENRTLLQFNSPGPRIRQSFKTPQHFRSLFDAELRSWHEVCQTAKHDGVCAFSDEYRMLEESDVPDHETLSREFIDQMTELGLPFALQVELALAAIEEIIDSCSCPVELIEIAKQAGHRNLIDQCLYFFPTITVLDPAVGSSMKDELDKLIDASEEAMSFRFRDEELIRLALPLLHGGAVSAPINHESLDEISGMQFDYRDSRLFELDFLVQHGGWFSWFLATFFDLRGYSNEWPPREAHFRSRLEHACWITTFSSDPQQDESGGKNRETNETTALSRFNALHDDAAFPRPQIEEISGLPPGKLRGRLERFRKNPVNADGWSHEENLQPRKPRYKYRIGSIRQLVTDAITAHRASIEKKVTPKSSG